MEQFQPADESHGETYSPSEAEVRFKGWTYAEIEAKIEELEGTAVLLREEIKDAEQGRRRDQAEEMQSELDSVINQLNIAREALQQLDEQLPEERQEAA